jgi:hypothetical protein
MFRADAAITFEYLLAPSLLRASKATPWGNEVPRGNVIEMSNYCGKLPALACSPK